ncbi:MAG: radical SAM protein [Thermodesulfobacterium sp.]|nr:radical SAM protein [Thermodesulfobacterium sp.]
MKKRFVERREKGKRRELKPQRVFTLQWHVTARCENSCSHCYLQESEGYKSEIENELPLEECIKIVDDFHRMVERWNLLGRINFTGGDPLLKPGIFELIKRAREKNISVGILGNGEFLDLKTALKLKRLGINSYQVSLDGMEETHDRLRRKGSFKQALNGLRVLREIGIPTVVMFTVSKLNMRELIQVINLVAKEKVSTFDFARLVPIGKGAQLKEDLIDPEEYRELLLNVLKEYKRLENNGCETRFGRKDHLWKLLYQELGLLPPLYLDKKTIFGGCAIGIHLLVVVADGTVYPCRRLPIKIGRVPEQNLWDIFINSSSLNRMRQIERMVKCRGCDLLQYCRGCPAVAYGVTGDYFASDPQCWKNV